MSEGRGRADRLFRPFRLGPAPLRRGSDRLQVLARALLILMVLAAVPVALAVATATTSHTRLEVEAQAGHRHQVTATLSDDAPAADGTDQAEARTAVTAVWLAPSGIEREGTIRVRAMSKAGTAVTIWVDDAGDVTTRPLGNADAVSRAVTNGLATFLGLTLLWTAGYLATCQLIDRSRMRRWEEDWAVVEPVWSRKVP